MKRPLAIRLCWPVAFLLVVWSAALPDEPASTRSGKPHFDAYGDPLPTRAILRLGTSRFHHQAFIQDTAFSPDGRILASAAGNQDAAVTLWELPSGRLLRRLAAPLKDNFRPGANAVAFSPDGTRLLAAEMRGKVRLWDVATGEELYSIDAHPESLGATAGAFSADGRWFASGGGDGVVRLWSTQDGHELLSFDAVPQAPQHFGGMAWRGVFPAGSVAALSFSPDGTHLAVGIAEQQIRAKNGKILIWDIHFNQPVRWLDEPYGFLSSLAYTPDGKHLVSGTNSTVPREKLAKSYPYLEAHIVRLRVWDAENGELVRELTTPEKEPGLGAVALSQDGRTLAAGYENKILVWDLERGKILRSIDVPKWRGGRGLAMSSDGQIVCAPLENAIGLWSTMSGDSLLADMPSHGSFVNRVAYLADDNTIVTSGGDTVRLWNAATGRQSWSRRFGSHAYVNALAASPDGSLIAAGGQTELGETAVRVYQSATGDEVNCMPMFRKKWYASSVHALAFTPDGGTLAVVRDRPKESNTYDLDLVDVKTGNRLKEVACGFFAGVRPIAFTQDARSLYTIGHQDAVVKVWDLATGAGRQLFTALKPPAEPVDAKKQKPFASDAAFSPDLKTLITSQSHELIVWDVARGEPIATIPTEGTDKGGNIAISNDGRWLAMTDLNYAGDPGSNAIRLFDLSARRLMATLDPGQVRASSFAFSPDSTRLVTGMSDGTALLWDLATAAKSCLTE